MHLRLRGMCWHGNAIRRFVRVLGSAGVAGIFERIGVIVVARSTNLLDRCDLRGALGRRRAAVAESSWHAINTDQASRGNRAIKRRIRRCLVCLV